MVRIKDTILLLSLMRGCFMNNVASWGWKGPVSRVLHLFHFLDGGYIRCSKTRWWPQVSQPVRRSARLAPGFPGCWALFLIRSIAPKIALTIPSLYLRERGAGYSQVALLLACHLPRTPYFGSLQASVLFIFLCQEIFISLACPFQFN